MKSAVTITSPDVPQQVIISLFSGTFKERIAKAAEAGFDGIELLPLDPTRLDTRRLVEIVHGAGLQVAAIGTGIQASIGGLCLISQNTEVEKNAKLRMYQLIDLADYCGASVVTLGSFRGKLDTANAVEVARFDGILAELSDYATSKSVVIAIEPLNRYENSYLNSASEVIALINRIESSSIGLLLDSFHMNIEESSVEKTIEEAGDHIAHVHIGDSNRLSPGKGHFNFSSMVQALKLAGYNRWLSAELFAMPDADTAGRETGIYLRSLIDSFVTS